MREENPLLFKNICLTSKLGFADVIMPGDVRNDLYLLLEKGEFERGGKSTGKNIEVTILVLDADTNILEVFTCVIFVVFHLKKNDNFRIAYGVHLVQMDPGNTTR